MTANKFKSAAILAVTLIIAGAFHAAPGNAQIGPGSPAPLFSLKDVYGRPYDLKSMAERPMIILYFFDVDSQPSREGLVNLDRLAKQYKDTDLLVWGITFSPQDQVTDFVTANNLNYPILMDHEEVSDEYGAQLILPTACILGPGLTVLDYYQGGGKTTEVMLIRLAERELQRNQTALAKAIGEQVEKSNPHNPKAKTIQGYAALKEGKLDEAEQTFEELSRSSGEAEVLGMEGLTAVYAKKGDSKKALQLAEEVEQKAPDRAYVHVVKGDMLYSQNRKAEAEQAYRQATQSQESELYQKTAAYNQLGRLQASLGNYEVARELYDQAIDIDPLYIEATSNKGVTYEKQGQWEKAHENYSKALKLNQGDTFARVLAKNSEEMLALQKDTARRERVDKLVKDLAARYRSQKSILPSFKDKWTSRPMILSFVDFREKGGLVERDGMSLVITTQLAEQLNRSGRVQVVERVLIERLLEELNLGSSDLADPETALKLGRVLAAKLIGTGALFHMPDKTLLSLRLIDTETSAIAKVFSRPMGAPSALAPDISRLDREILQAIMHKYPLRGFVIQADSDQVVINLGARHGVVAGSKFQVLQEGKKIKYKGKVLRGPARVVAEVEIAEAGPDMSFARVLQSDRAIEADDKVQEKMQDVTPVGG